jgi:predicted aconitase with swiveling domain
MAGACSTASSLERQRGDRICMPPAPAIGLHVGYWSVDAMDKIILKGRKVVGGVAEGEAFVTRHTISGWGGIDHTTGTIVEMRHEKRGQSFAGKVLVFPGAKGSSGWSHYFHMARIAGVAPKAMVFNIMTTKVALGAVVVRAPAVTGLDRDPLDVIEDGDWVKVDGDNGIVEVTKRAR